MGNLKLTQRGRMVIGIIVLVALMAAPSLTRPSPFDPRGFDYYSNSRQVYVGTGSACPPYSLHSVAGSNGFCFPG